MKIDTQHPRATSLRIREKLVWGVKQGITSPAGLLAHGRGEAFDYLFGEITHPFAHQAIEAAAAQLVVAKHPVLSINGNVAVLSADDMIRLAAAIPAVIEVNLFHYTKGRIRRIEQYLHSRARTTKRKQLILSRTSAKTITLPDIASSRKITLHSGIATADVVLVPLEDGDRAQALVGMGKKVITIDLNPLSRTAQAATITIVDNITRALPLLLQAVKEARQKPREQLEAVIAVYDNTAILSHATHILRATY